MPDEGAAKIAPDDEPASDDKLVEGEDFYWEGSFMVFTAHYLRRRGYCCERGCRHCPYQFETEYRAAVLT
jgi:hypothetical protein